MSAPNRCLISLILFTIVVVGIIATVSLILGFLIALYTPEEDNNNGGIVGQGGNGDGVDTNGSPDSYNGDAAEGHYVSEHYYTDQRIWLIHIGAFNHRVQYLDDETEQVKGFDADIVNAVCRWSMKRCRIVYDSYGNCINTSNNSIGLGLLNNYYYACAGWAVSYERQETVVFGTQYHQASGSLWATRRGNPGSFDPFDLSGARVGLVRDWSANLVCLNRLRGVQGLIPLTDNQVEYYDNIELLVEDLNSGDIDVGFIGEPLFDESRMTQVGDEIRTCTAGDVGVLAAPTSVGTEFIQWWNAGLNRLLNSREYGEICDRLETVHGHKEGGSKEEICLTQYL